MKEYRIALLPGDGIGPEVVAPAVQALEAAGRLFGFSLRFETARIGGAAIDADGTPLPEETLAVCRRSDAALMGAVGGPKWDTLPGDRRPEAGLLGIRGALGLFANLRPAKVFSPLADASPVKNAGQMDVLVVRELTGGIYFGRRGRLTQDGVAAAFDTEQYSVPEIERIARAAFDAAARRRGKLASVDKANVLESSRLWRETVTRVAREYPQIETEHLYVDNAAMQLIRRPGSFDVVLASNLFGDILSDEAAMLSGSIGLLPSASLGAGAFGLYEPVHGSAPDIAGQDRANPLATILSAAMLLRHSLGETAAADRLEAAVDAALAVCRTPDLPAAGLPVVGTAAMGEAVLDALR